MYSHLIELNKKNSDIQSHDEDLKRISVQNKKIQLEASKLILKGNQTERIELINKIEVSSNKPNIGQYSHLRSFNNQTKSKNVILISCR